LLQNKHRFERTEQQLWLRMSAVPSLPDFSRQFHISRHTGAINGSLGQISNRSISWVDLDTESKSPKRHSGAK